MRAKNNVEHRNYGPYSGPQAVCTRNAKGCPGLEYRPLKKALTEKSLRIRVKKSASYVLFLRYVLHNDDYSTSAY